MNQTPAIQLTALTKSFGAIRAVDGIDLRINAGEVALLGPSGPAAPRLQVSA